MLGLHRGGAARARRRRGERQHGGTARLGVSGRGPQPLCAGAAASEVGSTLGLSLGKQVTNLEGPVSVCAYLGKYMVMVRFQSGETAQEFGQSRKSLLGLHQAVRDVAGLGDQAYYASAGKAGGQQHTGRPDGAPSPCSSPHPRRSARNAR